MDIFVSKAISDLLKKDLPEFKVGDTVRVVSKVFEGEGERFHTFEGVVVSRSGKATNETFTVRKVSYGIGVERIFPLHSPSVEKIVVIKSGRARRAKLFYLRRKTGKEARVKDKRPNE